MCLMFRTGDTTAYSITWLLLEILRPEHANQNLLQRVREDIEKSDVHKLMQYGEGGVSRLNSMSNCMCAIISDPCALVRRIQKLKFLNALWNESIRLNTVSPAGQMQIAEDDVLPPVPELGIPARPVKKYGFIF
jgi:cytochrome P450